MFRFCELFRQLICLIFDIKKYMKMLHNFIHITTSLIFVHILSIPKNRDFFYELLKLKF